MQGGMAIRRMDNGANVLSAPTTPGHQLPLVDRSKADPEIVKAAEGMEAMFLDYMMKVMRETVPKNEMDMENPATAIYRGMMDSEMAQKAAHNGGTGLANQLIAYLDSQRYNLPRGQGVPAKQQASAVTTKPVSGTGGTHEGQPVHE
jgi:flagellar protein FlgJ